MAFWACCMLPINSQKESYTHSMYKMWLLIWKVLLLVPLSLLKKYIILFFFRLTQHDFWSSVTSQFSFDSSLLTFLLLSVTLKGLIVAILRNRVEGISAKGRDEQLCGTTEAATQSCKLVVLDIAGSQLRLSWSSGSSCLIQHRRKSIPLHHPPTWLPLEKTGFVLLKEARTYLPVK